MDLTPPELQAYRYVDERGESWETVVSGWDCTPLQVPVVPAAVEATI